MTALERDTAQQVQETLLAAASMHRGGDVRAAEAAYRLVLGVAPDHPDALHLLGLVCHQRNEHEQAVELITRAIAHQPQTAIFHNSLGAALERLLQLTEAVAHYRRAIALDPGYAQAWTNLGIALQRQARLHEAARAYRHAIELEPSRRSAHSHLLFCLSHVPDCDPETLAAEHVRWAERFADQLPPIDGHEACDLEPERRLRVGYVSPDFRHHPVASFIEPVIAAHDRAAVKVVCYSDARRTDEVTAHLRGLADDWVDATGLDDEALARRVRADGVDVFVDLAGHTQHHRLLAFARRPAPVQVSYLGYAATTGLRAIDYRITDGWADPEGTTEQLHSEQLVRLPGGFLCYRPPAYAPPVPGRPRTEPGAVVFGSFNKASKLTTEVTTLWARILRELPASRLVLKSVSFGDEATRHDFHARFAGDGVAPERVTLLPPVALPSEHLALYEQVDVALDPFPYHGATSTCEALWMGAPVVTRAGRAHAGRVGVSLLHAVGLEALVADTPDAYVATAVALARDTRRLTGLHGSLRERMRASPLCDAARIASELEDAYRTMWRRYCASAEGAPLARTEGAAA